MLLFTKKVGIIARTLYNYFDSSNSQMKSTPLSRTVSPYAFYKTKKLAENYNGKLPIDLILPRWIIGVYNTGSRILNHKDFSVLLKETEYKLHL